MAPTQPGVQKPHCEPWPSAIAICAFEKPSTLEPSPSAVVIARPSHAQSSRRHALIGLGTPSAPTATTVHAPQPPSPHATLVPVSSSVLRR